MHLHHTSKHKQINKSIDEHDEESTTGKQETSILQVVVSDSEGRESPPNGRPSGVAGLFSPQANTIEHLACNLKGSKT